MKEWFAHLETRERIMISAGGAIAAVIVVWGLIWMPLRNNSAELRESLLEKQNLLADLQRLEALPSAGTAVVRGGDSQSMVVLVDRTAQAMGLAGSFTRTRPDGADAISVSFTNAPFDNIVTWLISLEQSNGVLVETASFNGAREQGLVSGQLFLRRL